jgi:SAM-dependent methyltransferase
LCQQWNADVTAIAKGPAQQYADSRKLAARSRLNRKYTLSAIPWFEWVAQQLLFQKNDSVLDVGSGSGWFWTASANVLPEGLALTLVDSSAGMIDEAMQHCRKMPLASIECRIGDALALPFGDDCFDKVLAMHMLYHVSDPAVGIREMFRVLKPGGWLAVTTNDTANKREIHELTAAFDGAASDPAAAIFGYDTARHLMYNRFGNVDLRRYPAHMRITNPDDVFVALTSYPPGDQANDAQLAAFRKTIEGAFRSGNGVLEVRIETGLFLSQKRVEASNNRS